MPPFQPLLRQRFFLGQILGADDFQRSQDYFMARHRRTNRFGIGWGVLAGLQVSVVQGDTVVVQPGLAIDCAGNEVVLEAVARLPLTALSGRQHVVLQYHEVPEAAVPLPSGDVEFTAVRETGVLALSPASPAAGHAGMGCGTPGCGQAHAVGIAVLTAKAGVWRVSSALRPLKPARR